MRMLAAGFDLIDLSLPADQAGELARQVVPVRQLSRQGGKFVHQPRGADLVQALWQRHALERVLAHIFK
jgi:hypothetical protein